MTIESSVIMPVIVNSRVNRVTSTAVGPWGFQMRSAHDVGARSGVYVCRRGGSEAKARLFTRHHEHHAARCLASQW